jgi:hypothetical protein
MQSLALLAIPPILAILLMAAIITREAMHNASAEWKPYPKQADIPDWQPCTSYRAGDVVKTPDGINRTIARKLIARMEGK